MTIDTIKKHLYTNLFYADKPISALQAWSLIDDTLTQVHNDAITQAVNAVISWADSKDHGDYDTFSAASAINGVISKLKVKQ